MKLLQINACAYCGGPSEGNYSIERDGMGSKPALRLCDACGAHPRPSIQEIWGRIAIVDDDGTEWGPTVLPCARPERLLA